MAEETLTEPLYTLDSTNFTDLQKANSSTLNISQEALTREFCSVSDTLKAISSTIRESVQVQKSMLENGMNLSERLDNLIAKADNTNNKLDEIDRSIDAMHACLDEFMEKNQNMTVTLSDNTQQIVNTINGLTTAINSKI